jgi:hypothetical protein
MSRAIIVSVSAMLLASATALAQPAPSSPAGHQPGEESAVLAALDRFVHAISAKDLPSMAAMQTPDGMTYVARPKEGGGIEIVGRPNSYWVDPARAEGPALRERYWSPTVLVRGAIAVVWAPYEFWTDGKTSHCGVDVFDLVKIDGEWKVSNSMWTVEPDACTELRPADASKLRAKG